MQSRIRMQVEESIIVGKANLSFTVSNVEGHKLRNSLTISQCWHKSELPSERLVLALLKSGLADQCSRPR